MPILEHECGEPRAWWEERRFCAVTRPVLHILLLHRERKPSGLLHWKQKKWCTSMSLRHKSNQASPLACVVFGSAVVHKPKNQALGQAGQ